jgi:hypothetical protein
VRSAAALPAPANRYSICSVAGALGARSAAIWPGTTQPSAESPIELA